MNADAIVPRQLHGLGEAWARREADWLRLHATLVDINTFADNLPGIDASRALIRPQLEALGFEVEEPLLHPACAPRPRAAHLVARRPGAGPRVLLIAHLDTVFPPGDAFDRLVRDGDLLKGPGVGDIKGGVVTILAALALLRDTGLPDAPALTVVMNSDEEMGSHASWDLLRGLAAPSACALGFEPAFHAPDESVLSHTRIQHVVRRKGCGRYRFELAGVAAHSGGAHHLGSSAIEALARKVLDVHALTDRDAGVTTNVGLVAGGRSANTVAPNARGEIDFRFVTAEDGERASRRIAEILAREEDVNPPLRRPVTCRVEAGGGALWPPLIPTVRSLALSGLIGRVTESLGLRAEAITRGGASDAAHAAAVGVPAVCGLGPVTSGIHTDSEQTSVPALRNSALVAATLLASLAAAE